MQSALQAEACCRDFDQSSERHRRRIRQLPGCGRGSCRKSLLGISAVRGDPKTHCGPCRKC